MFVNYSNIFVFPQHRLYKETAIWIGSEGRKRVFSLTKKYMYDSHP